MYVSHKIGESRVQLRTATQKMMDQYQSKIDKPGIIGLESLRQTMNLHKEINEISKKKRQRLALANNFANLDQFANKIVAKKSFFLNPAHNNPKIIKTEKKLYVI